MHRLHVVARPALPVTTPTARMAQRGVHSLLDHEIVAMVLGDESIPGIERAIELLEDYGGIHGVSLQRRRSDARHEELTQAEACAITAVGEFITRAELAAAITRDALTSPAAVRNYLKLTMANLEHQMFNVVWLDAQNRVIAVEEMFTGTLEHNSIHVREVVKSALAHNAAAAILAQSRPSAAAEATVQDQAITRTLAEGLALLDVRIVDHFIVAPGVAFSFAERGLL